MNRIALTTVLALCLSACMTTPAPANGGPIPPSASTCNSAPAAWAVGKQATTEVVERVRVDSHSRIVRMLRPGQMVTMEFSADRVDVRVDVANVILLVSCG